MYANYMISGFSDEISSDIDVQFTALNKMGIKFFEPRGVNGKNISSLTDEELTALKGKMGQYRIKASSIGSPIGKIKITDDFEPHFETFKRTCYIARFLGAPTIRMFSFFIPDGEYDKYRDEVLRRLRLMVDYAAKEKVVLLHENEKGIYGENDERCLDILSSINSPYFKAVFDPANFVQPHVDTKKAFALLKDYVTYMHIKDAKEDGSVVPAGYGEGNVSWILGELEKMGYYGFLSLEPHLGAFTGLSDIDDTANETVSKEKSDEAKFSLAYESLKNALKEAGHNMNKVKMGIIGFGNMGMQHARNISEGRVPKMELAAICDIDPEKAAKAKSDYNVPTFTDAEEMMKSGLCDSVLIAIPHYDHSPYAIMAFNYGLNVLTEKPAGVHTKQVLEMNEAAKKSGKVFGIMFNQRTNPMYQKLREMIKSGELGHIKRISWIVTDWYRSNAYHKSATWRSTWDKEGGGTLVNQNPHQLDLWQWMFGMPDTVYADCSFGKYHDIDVDDEVTAYLTYKNGTTGTYITSTAEAPGTNRLEIACDAGKIVIESGKMIFKKLKQAEPEFDKTNTVPFACPEYQDVLMDVSGSGPQHVGILNDYAEAVLNGTPLLAPGEEGINGVTLASAMYLSTWRGVETIDLNNFPHQEFYERLMEKAANAKEKKGVKSQTVDIDGTY